MKNVGSFRSELLGAKEVIKKNKFLKTCIGNAIVFVIENHCDMWVKTCQINVQYGLLFGV